MRRVPIAELVKHTGLSRATIDRALNGRGGVHARTRRIVEETLERLSHEDRPGNTAGLGVAPAVEADIVLRVGRGMQEQLSATRDRLGLAGLTIHDLYQQADEEVLQAVRELCRDVERPLVLAVKNTEPLRAVLQQARRQGKRIVSFVSDLHHDARDAFVGIDNRMAGQTAAYVLGRQFGHREARVAIALGDYAFRCHEDREIGFRAMLRSGFPSLSVADVAKGEDSPEQTYLALQALLRQHGVPDAIYNVAGGNLGIARALTEAGIDQRVTVISHEANHITAPLMLGGVIDYVLAQHPESLLRTLCSVLADTREDAPQRDVERHEMNTVNVALYTRYNLPDYAT